MNIKSSQYTLNGIFEIGRRGMATQQANLAITGNNITNVNTVGYTRQRLEVASATPLQASDMNVESGLLFETTRRLRDTFFDLQLRDENPGMARWSEEYRQLGLIENIFAEPGENGLSTLMDKHFQSWEKLTHDPQSQSARTVVRDSAQSLTNNFNRIGKSLDRMQAELDDNILDTASQANYFIREIASATKKIMQSEAGTSEISSLMDQRDLALDNLSKIIDIQYVEKDDGNLLVYSNGVIVAQKDDFNQIVADKPQNNKLSSFKWKNENSEVVVQSGKFKALLNVRDDVIENIKSDLNTFVKTFVEEVNKQHRKNFTLEGNSGYDFFDPEGTDIYSVGVEESLLKDVSFIAASQRAGSAGNGDGALAIVELANKKCINNDSLTMKDFYNGVLTNHGTYTKEAKKLSEMQKSFVLQLENRRNEAGQVELNEELSNMIKFQQSFGACTKVMTNVDEMIKTVLSLV